MQIDTQVSTAIQCIIEIVLKVNPVNLEVSLNGWIGNVQMAGKLSKLVEISVIL